MVATAQFINYGNTVADSPTEFRAGRGSLTALALAPRGAGVSFSRVPCGPRALSTAAIAGVRELRLAAPNPCFPVLAAVGTFAAESSSAEYGTEFQ